MKVRLCLLLTVGLLLLAAESPGRPPLARQVSGRVVELDRQSQIILVAYAQQAKPLHLEWRERTQFVENGRFSTAGALKAGERIELWYRAPLFGKPFATKVVWSKEAGAPAK
jgi:hypothetical protein